jgi:nondiscriminating aspartyl-tRNA synthetase
MDGKEVRIAGWVHEIRNIGKIVFMVVRDHTGLMQVTAKQGTSSQEVMNAMNLVKESVVSVKGIVKKNTQAKKGIEISPLEITDLNPITSQIPFEVTGKVPADLDVRLNYRYIDFRRLETTAVFNVESTILNSFRNLFHREGFEEIRTPNLVEEATEGGTDLFPVQYFEKKAFLAQSPQLYKQLAVIGGMDRVFMIVPVFRAEKHNTVFHLNECTQMDIEMGFADHNDAIRWLETACTTILKDLAANNAEDLETLGASVKDQRVHVVTYKQVLSTLNSNDIKIEFGEDLNREHEEMLAKLYGDVVIVKEYPTAIRAFYSMPNENNPEISNSYDLIYKGLEIASGAQRIHDAKLLEDTIKKRKMNPARFAFYVNAFKQGAPPHAGWSIGLERFTMKVTGRSNIRECALFPRDRERLVP